MNEWMTWKANDCKQEAGIKITNYETESLINGSLVGSRPIAVWIVEVELGEDNANSFAIVAVETVSADDVGRIAACCAVVERRNRTRLTMIRADHVRTAIYIEHTTHTNYKSFNLADKTDIDFFFFFLFFLFLHVP